MRRVKRRARENEPDTSAPIQEGKRVGRRPARYITPSSPSSGSTHEDKSHPAKRPRASSNIRGIKSHSAKRPRTRSHSAKQRRANKPHTQRTKSYKPMPHPPAALSNSQHNIVSEHTVSNFLLYLFYPFCASALLSHLQILFYFIFSPTALHTVWCVVI